ncbi:MAG TPA: RNA 2',3'-cyclic phosphodiesterase [archaeon]|nr:RNA 2',3'-cyclic phosphodiesterase [archaeon]
MSRLFAAVDIPSSLREKIVDIQKDIGQKNAEIKFVEPQNLHYTIKFLGKVDPQKLEEIKNILFAVGENFQKFTVSVRNLGYFVYGNQIKVLWIGMGEGKDEFVKVAEVADKRLSYIREGDFGPSPHLTIGRVEFVKDKENLVGQLKRFNNIELGSFVVEEIKLKESVLNRSGPVYKDLGVFKLG